MPAILSAIELHLAYGTQVLMDAASLAIYPRDKAGLVGRNGCGKTSFLKIAAGLENADTGDVTRSQGLVTGYLAQDFTLDENASVGENIRAGAAGVLELIRNFEAGKGSSAELAALQDRIDAADGWNLDARVKMFVDQLGAPDPERGLAGLSGGEKRRVALCRALVSQPDLLILDEPTNHLDSESIAWLENYLIQLPAAVLFVTHDRYFLDRIATRVVELAGGRFFSHDGNYNEYLAAKAQREQMEQAQESRRQRFLKSELEWVRAGVKARTTKSRHRLESFYEVAAKNAPEQEIEMELVIPPPPALGNIVVEAENIGHKFGDAVLLHGLDISFEAGTCTGVIGRNGLGKTTLLRILMGDLEPDTGEVRIGKRTQFNYIDQTRVQLDGTKSVLEEVAGKTDFVTFGDKKLSVRGYLRRFLFTDHRINERVDRLSGGEQNRVMLAKILRKGGNFLILDEPTNDLDLPTLRVLEEAIVMFDGVVLAVSHDRYFLDRICDRILAFEGEGKIVIQEGNYSYYIQKRAENAVSAQKSTAPTKETRQNTSKPAESDDDKPRKLKWKEERELEGLEPQIAQTEARVAEIEQAFADSEYYKTHGHDHMEALTDELAALKADIEKLYSRWEELELIRQADTSN